MAGVPSGGLFAPPQQRGGLFAPPQMGGVFAAGGGQFGGTGASGSWAPEPTFWEKLPNTVTYRILADLWQAIETPGKVWRGEMPAMILTEDGRWTTNPELIERSADLAGLAGAGMLPRAASGAARSLAPRSSRMYDPPVRPARPFEDDCPAGARADAAGRLTHDIEGRPLVAEHVVGRRMVGGSDEPLAEAALAGLAQKGTGRHPQVVPRDKIGEDSGRLVVRYNEDGDYLGQAGILTADDLATDQAVKTLAHELAHSIDLHVAPPSTRTEFRGMRWGIAAARDDDVIQEQLYRVYRDLNNPRAKHWGPTDEGYARHEVGKELWAEAIRAYMADPNYLKSVAPETAAAIRAAVNDNDQLRHIIQFNVGGVPGGLTSVATLGATEDTWSRE